jgi:hypothetical protein
MRCRSVEAESHPHPHSYRVVSATSDSSRVAAEDFGGADGRILFVIRQCRVCEVKFARVRTAAVSRQWRCAICTCSPARNIWGMELSISNSQVLHAPYLFTINLSLTLCWSSVFFQPVRGATGHLVLT